MSQHDSNIESADQSPLTPAESRRALWVAAIAWGVFGSAWMNLITGAPFVNFARSLGASTFMFGLLSSLPFVGVLLQLPGSYIVEKTRRRRRLFMIGASSQRLTWLLVAALPWLISSKHPDLRVGALLALSVISSMFGHAGSPAWLSWFADLVPVEIRGRYLGKRAALATITAVIASGAAGWILDRNSSFAVFSAIFAVAAILGVTDIWLFFLVREAPMEKDEGPPWRLRNVVSVPLGDRPFRFYLLYAFSESIVFAISAPFFWLIGLEVLDIGNLWSNIYIMMLPMVLTALTFPLWGGVCDRFGARPVVTLGTLATIAFPLCWLFATPSHYHVLLAAAAVIAGAFGAAVQVADITMMFGLTPRRNRSAYLAMISVAASVGWVLGPSLGGAIAQALKPVNLVLGGYTFVNLHFLLAISILLRLVHVALVIPRLPEESQQTTGALIRHVSGWPLRQFAGLRTRRR